MCAIQQITSNYINNNLLYILSTKTLSLATLIYFNRYLMQCHYSTWIALVFVITCLAEIFLFHGEDIQFVFIFFHGLFVAAILDSYYRILPNGINYSLLSVGLILSLTHHFISFLESILGVLLGYFFLFCIAFVYRKITQRVGMGGGDLKLTAALGAWIGFEWVIYLLFWASLLSCFFYWVMAIQGKYHLNTKIPFGLFLSLVGITIFTLRFSLWHG